MCPVSPITELIYKTWSRMSESTGARFQGICHWERWKEFIDEHLSLWILMALERHNVTGAVLLVCRHWWINMVCPSSPHVHLFDMCLWTWLNSGVMAFKIMKENIYTLFMFRPLKCFLNFSHGEKHSANKTLNSNKTCEVTHYYLPV